MDTSRGPRPRRTTSTGATPRPGRSVGVAPSRTVSVAAAGSVPRPWVQVPRAVGVGELILAASAALDVTLTASSEDAVLTLAASSLTEAVGGYFETAGVAEMPLAASSVWEVILAAAGEGTLDLTASSVSDSTVKLQAMGMNKSGTYSSSGTWPTIPGWVVRSGFDSTTITDNGLVMNAAGTVTVTWSITAASPANNQYRITKNGVVLQTFAQAVASGTTTSFTVAAGDVIHIQGSFFFGSTSVTAGYLYTSVV